MELDICVHVILILTELSIIISLSFDLLSLFGVASEDSSSACAARISTALRASMATSRLLATGVCVSTCEALWLATAGLTIAPTAAPAEKAAIYSPFITKHATSAPCIRDGAAMANFYFLVQFAKQSPSVQVDAQARSSASIILRSSSV